MSDVRAGWYRQMVEIRLFEEKVQELFMQGLIDANYIVPGSVAASSFFKAISFEGPMYKVFTDDEIRLWEEWVEWLGQQTQPQKPETDPAKLMAMCIDALRSRQRRPDVDDDRATRAEKHGGRLDRAVRVGGALVADENRCLVHFESSSSGSTDRRIPGSGSATSPSATRR